MRTHSCALHGCAFGGGSVHEGACLKCLTNPAPREGWSSARCRAYLPSADLGDLRPLTDTTSRLAVTKADDTQQHTQSLPGPSFFRLKFNNLKLKSKETDENAKGSLGLDLLYCPTDPVADFVFVHGLGGGSRRTWSKSSNLEQFWPIWLPQAPDFKDVRIHSFGYNSDWASMKQDMSNISDFALLLLNTLQ